MELLRRLQYQSPTRDSPLISLWHSAAWNWLDCRKETFYSILKIAHRLGQVAFIAGIYRDAIRLAHEKCLHHCVAHLRLHLANLLSWNNYDPEGAENIWDKMLAVYGNVTGCIWSFIMYEATFHWACHCIRRSAEFGKEDVATELCGITLKRISASKTAIREGRDYGAVMLGA